MKLADLHDKSDLLKVHTVGGELKGYLCLSWRSFVLFRSSATQFSIFVLDLHQSFAARLKG